MKQLYKALFLSVFCLLSAKINAGDKPNPARSPLLLAQAGNNISKSKAADIAKAKYGGKVLNVEEVDKDGEKVFRVKLLLDGGRVKIVTVNGSNGKLS